MDFDGFDCRALRATEEIPGFPEIRETLALMAAGATRETLGSRDSRALEAWMGPRVSMGRRASLG